jgi:hypothetical protein
MGEPQQDAKNRLMPALDSHEESLSSPDVICKSSVLIPAVVPKVDPECLRQRQQWQ